MLPLNPGVYAEIARGIQDAGSSRETVILLQGILDAVLQINPTLVLDGTTLAKASTGYFEAEQKRRRAVGCEGGVAWQKGNCWR